MKFRWGREEAGGRCRCPERKWDGLKVVLLQESTLELSHEKHCLDVPSNDGGLKNKEGGDLISIPSQVMGRLLANRKTNHALAVGHGGQRYIAVALEVREDRRTKAVPARGRDEGV